MKVKVKRGSSFQTKDGKTHREGEVLEVGKHISREEYDSHKSEFEHMDEKKDTGFDEAFEDRAEKRQ
jgi:hypothetical protein